MASVAHAAAPFTVRLAGAGAFPRPSAPRTLWIGVVDGAQPLADLAARLDDALASSGWHRETRPYRAHLTLARSDGMRAGPPTLELLAAELGDRQVAWEADRLVLFESVTGSGPAKYERLVEVPFPRAATLHAPERFR